VLIREPEDETTRGVKSIISNVQREDVGPVELAEALQSLLDEDERIKSQDDLANTIGKTKAWVSGMLRILTLPSGLQQKVGSTQRSVSYDAMIRIARLENHSHQAELVERLIGGASQREIRDRIDEMKGKSKTPATSETTPKPKRVYRTAHHATVIVQGTHARLANDEVIGALQEALDNVHRT
jgi:ParB family chromosome partitioning protein